MDKKITDAYAWQPGKSARCVASWAATTNAKDLARAAKRAPNARGERDLMHPKLWSLWLSAPVEAFGSIISSIDPREAAVLSCCADIGGRGVVDFFAEQPKKLAVLAQVGVDLGRPGSTELWGWKVDPAVSHAARGNVAGILGLAAAGLAAPGPFSAEAGDFIAGIVSKDRRRVSARTALQLLAITPGLCELAKTSPGPVIRAMEWLATGADPGLRNAQGQDALGMAVDAGCAATARLLLGMGLNPTRKDSKGRNVMELLSRRARALRMVGDAYGCRMARELDELAPHLLGFMELRELDMAAPLAPEATARRRHGL